MPMRDACIGMQAEQQLSFTKWLALRLSENASQNVQKHASQELPGLLSVCMAQLVVVSPASRYTECTTFEGPAFDHFLTFCATNEHTICMPKWQPKACISNIIPMPWLLHDL